MNRTVHVKIDWKEFYDQIIYVIQNGRKEIVEEGEMSINYGYNLS